MAFHISGSLSLFIFVTVGALFTGSIYESLSCYCFPGEPCWPPAGVWNEFNHTVGGRLIETTPIASVCHGETYDAPRCDKLRDEWFFPETHLPSSSSVMAPIFANNSCNPFTSRDELCAMGNYVAYAVRVRDAADTSETLRFATKHRIRLFIRNTGHDYNGKSTGAGALSIWTRDIDDISLFRDYRSSEYDGPAVRLGAGVEVQAAHKFADANNGIIVGGNCPTVGIAGGFTQGGGHSPLATKFGLASDQVLEWDVLLASGEVVVASPTSHPDLYWALCGGGPSTYGLVLSMTVKLHPPMFFSAAKLSFATPTSEGGAESFWGAVKTFAELLPNMVDAGLQVIFFLVPGAFVVSPATGAGILKITTDELFHPIFEKLDKEGISYQYDSQEFGSFLDSYTAMNLPSANVSDATLGGRLLPRSSVEQDIDYFMAALKAISESNSVFAGISLNVSQTPADKFAANPYWRKTLITGVLGSPYDHKNFEANMKAQKFMTDKLMPKLDVLTKGEPAAYLNEANFLEADWQQVFYGKNYQRLDQIKRSHDPKDIFYALGAVGSDRWAQKTDGRLCKA